MEGYRQIAGIMYVYVMRVYAFMCICTQMEDINKKLKRKLLLLIIIISENIIT